MQISQTSPEDVFSANGPPQDCSSRADRANAQQELQIASQELESIANGNDQMAERYRQTQLSSVCMNDPQFRQAAERYYSSLVAFNSRAREYKRFSRVISPTSTPDVRPLSIVLLLTTRHRFDCRRRLPVWSSRECPACFGQTHFLAVPIAQTIWQLPGNLAGPPGHERTRNRAGIVTGRPRHQRQCVAPSRHATSYGDLRAVRLHHITLGTDRLGKENASGYDIRGGCLLTG